MENHDPDIDAENDALENDDYDNGGDVREVKLSESPSNPKEKDHLSRSWNNLVRAQGTRGCDAKSRKRKGALITPNKVVKVAKNIHKKPSSRMSTSDRELIAKVHQDIARFWYQAGIPFTAACFKAFKQMLKSIGQFGPHLPPPSYHQLKGPLLVKELTEVKNVVANHKKTWATEGCSLMLDVWSNRSGRTLINILVNSSSRTVFLKSIDASNDIKTEIKMFEIMDEQVKSIGPQNVVQVITPDHPILKLAGGFLQVKYPHLYWTPCVAYSINLMLKDISAMPTVKRTLSHAIQLSNFLYSHGYILKTTREFTKSKNLPIPTMTCSATSFSALKSIYKQKANLENMFLSDKWSDCRLVNEAESKIADRIVHSPLFWDNTLYVLKLIGPLIHALKLLDGDEPAMGYIYKSMDRVKEAISTSFGGQKNEEKYKDVFEIIDRRWEVQLHCPLHAAAYYLNQAIFYDNPSIDSDAKVMGNLMKAMEKLLDTETRDKAELELSTYKHARGIFGCDMAVMCRKKRPSSWWCNYGASAPNLRKFAIRILGLTCSSSGHEKDWNTFEKLHAKKRNKLDQKRMNDLVYIKYNQNMLERHDSIYSSHPIDMQQINESNEWLLCKCGEGNENTQNDLVLGEDLTLGLAAPTTQAKEPTRNTKLLGATTKNARGSTFRSIGAVRASSLKASESRDSVPVMEEEECDFEQGEESEEEDVNIDLGWEGDEDDNVWDEEEYEEYDDDSC